MWLCEYYVLVYKDKKKSKDIYSGISRAEVIGSAKSRTSNKPEPN